MAPERLLLFTELPHRTVSAATLIVHVTGAPESAAVVQDAAALAGDGVVVRALALRHRP